MRAQTSASVQEQFSSCAGLGASESTQASHAGGQPGAAGNEGRAGSGPERLSSVQIARLGFRVQECSPAAAAVGGRKGLRFPAQVTRIAVSPACDGELSEPVYARAARSVAAAARTRAPPAPARDACGPAIVIGMPRRRRAATSRGPWAGAPVAQETLAALSARRSAPPPRPSKPVARRGWPRRRRSSAARSSGRPGPRRSARGAAWPPRRPGS
jgi:hypothetical protein